MKTHQINKSVSVSVFWENVFFQQALKSHSLKLNSLLVFLLHTYTLLSFNVHTYFNFLAVRLITFTFIYAEHFTVTWAPCLNALIIIINVDQCYMNLETLLLGKELGGFINIQRKFKASLPN